MFLLENQVTRFESICYWEGSKQDAVAGLLQRQPHTIVLCSLAWEATQLHCIVKVSRMGVAAHDRGHLGCSRVRMEVQASRHVAFSTHHNSLMWREIKKRKQR